MRYGHPVCTHLRSAPAGLSVEDPVSKKGQLMLMDGEVHTGDIGVRTEIKGTVVVFGRAGTVGRDVLPDFLGEIEVVDQVL